MKKFGIIILLLWGPVAVSVLADVYINNGSSYLETDSGYSSSQVMTENGNNSTVVGNGYCLKIIGNEGEISLKNVTLKDVTAYQSGGDVYIQFKRK